MNKLELVYQKGNISSHAFIIAAANEMNQNFWLESVKKIY